MTNEIATQNEIETSVQGFNLEHLSKVVPNEIDVSSLSTTRAKIIALHNAGKKKSEICKLVQDKNGKDLRFQHVYNTIKDFEARGK
jgi:hypothetical protein